VSRDNEDPVLASVEAYNNDPDGYREKYKQHKLDLPERFNSLLAPNSDVLDVGCGPGRDLDFFASCGHRVVGVELNSSFYDMCSSKHKVVNGDMRELTTFFSPQTFDGIWAQASLVHLSTDEVEAVIADCFTLLRPGGLFYASIPSSGATGWRDETDGRRWYTVWPDETITTPLLNAGFTVFDISSGPYVEVWARK
jgi:SAM-dependent methyltransferase